MGCTQSKTKEEQKDFTDLREAGPPAQSPERAPTNDAPAAKQHLENDDGEVIRGDAPVAKKRDKRFQFGGPLDECLAGDITACFKTGLLFRIVLQDTWYFYNDSSDYEMTVQFTYGPQSEVTPLDATRLAPAEGTDWPSLKLTVYPGETKRLMKGAFNGYKSKYNAVPLTPEYKQRLAEESEARLKKAIDAVKALGHFDTAEERLAACVKHGVPYVDLDFMPGTESLSKRDDTRQLAPTAWQRPTEFIPADQHSGIRVFKDSVEPNDIDQGQLGDCWFLCSVASVAEFPSKIKDMFKHPHGADVARQERLLGAYRVTYNKNGWWRIVIVDDYLPCVGNRPCFAKNDTDVAELWPALIEKGYAKLHGSYSSITGGDALHALQDLTGYPTSRFDTEWEDAVNDKKENGLGFFADLLRYDSSGYLINLNTPGVDNSAYMGSHGANNTKEFEERYKAAGLGMGHAYSVIAVKEFPKEGVHLLQIRNPWGNSTEWTGAWSDASDKWQQYPAIAKACDFKAASDGTFWMEWNDVKKYFDGGGVCFTKFDWFDYRVQGAWKSGAPNLVLEVTAHEDVEAFVVLSQNDRRGQPRGSVDAKYAAVMVSVCRPDAGQNRLKVHLSSTSDADKPKEGFTFLFARDVSVKYTFAANAKPYLIVPRMYDESIPNKDFVLGLITNKAVAAGKLSVKFRQLPADAPVFKNYMGFTYDPATAAVVNDRPYQFNPEVGAPITLRGAEIVPQ